MKRLILFSLSLACLVSFGAAQSIKMLNAPTGLIDVAANAAEKKIGFNVTNTSTDTVEFAVLRLENNMTTGTDTFHSTFFCWDFCYGIGTDQSAEAISIAPDDTLNRDNVSQYVVFQPGGIDGYSYVTFRFINKHDPNDYIDVKYEFSVGGVTDIEELNPRKVLSAPYPNPASKFAYIDYELPLQVRQAELRVFNLLGKRVSVLPLDGQSGTASIATESLRSGIYILYLVADGKDITSRKLVISK